MKSWPRTLFGRHLLLMAALMLFGQVVSAWLFRDTVMHPRIQLAADTTVRNVRALRDGIVALPAAQRAAFAEAFNREAREHHEAARESSPLERLYLEQLALALPSPDGQPVWRRGNDRALEVRVVVDGTSYWLALRGLLNGRELNLTWLAGSAATMLLAILGAAWIQRHVDRPLNELVEAARTLGRGGTPPRLTHETPLETATVARSFDEMVAGLARIERERALMLAGLSHDLRTPLAKMRLATEMLAEQADAELLATLDRNIEGMDRLLGQFLEFTRASQPHRDDEAFVEVALDELVRDALLLCPDHGVQPRLQRLAPRPLRPQAVARLVLNLVVNAQRHGAPPVEVATGEQRDISIWLEVRDRGPGIAPDRVDMLKQPFLRGESTRDGPAGAGLGLAIVDRVAQAQGARFELLPRDGGGLVARVTWPAVAAPGR